MFKLIFAFKYIELFNLIRVDLDILDDFLLYLQNIGIGIDSFLIFKILDLP